MYCTRSTIPASYVHFNHVLEKIDNTETRITPSSKYFFANDYELVASKIDNGLKSGNIKELAMLAIIADDAVGPIDKGGYRAQARVENRVMVPANPESMNNQTYADFALNNVILYPWNGNAVRDDVSALHDLGQGSSQEIARELSTGHFLGGRFNMYTMFWFPGPHWHEMIEVPYQGSLLGYMTLQDSKKRFKYENWYYLRDLESSDLKIDTSSWTGIRANAYCFLHVYPFIGSNISLMSWVRRDANKLTVIVPKNELPFSFQYFS